ncbi:phosphoprotein [Cuiaba virus]|uniref:Phosphoprotein n=1 Tax=Cuiaba virus TaxID=2495751 RepID=A0A3S8TMN7_9RHAB|nr:phosphoprotein [Cuiaba virus]AZL49341.1 phosphoprotein [Cuiaba virus]
MMSSQQSFPKDFDPTKTLEAAKRGLKKLESDDKMMFGVESLDDEIEKHQESSSDEEEEEECDDNVSKEAVPDKEQLEADDFLEQESSWTFNDSKLYITKHFSVNKDTMDLVNAHIRNSVEKTLNFLGAKATYEGEDGSSFAWRVSSDAIHPMEKHYVWQEETQRPIPSAPPSYEDLDLPSRGKTSPPLRTSEDTTKPDYQKPSTSSECRKQSDLSINREFLDSFKKGILFPSIDGGGDILVKLADTDLTEAIIRDFVYEPSTSYQDMVYQIFCIHPQTKPDYEFIRW